MAKEKPIKWRNSDIMKLYRTIDNFNKKVRYWEKKGVIGLPEIQKVSNIKDTITTRREFNNIINSLQRFSKRGAEKVVENAYGVKASKWELREYAIKRAIRNKNFKEFHRELQKEEAAVKGINDAFSREDMGLTGVSTYRPLKDKFLTARSKKEFERAKHTAGAQSDPGYINYSLEIYKENYIESIKTTFVGKNIQPLIDKVKSMTPDQLYKFNVTHLDSDIEFIYSKAEVDIKFNQLLNVFDLLPKVIQSELTNTTHGKLYR